MMPAAKHGDPQMGVDIHLCVVPPSPSPVPLPTPHMSIVFDPFDYLPILGATVTVCGMKRAVAGTSGKAVHIPPGFPFAPKIPDTSDEIFMGSATVVADGDPFSFLAVPVLSCQVAGMPSPPRPKQHEKKLMLLPTTCEYRNPDQRVHRRSANHLADGHGVQARVSRHLGRLAKSRSAGRWRSASVTGARPSSGHLNPSFLKCTILRAEPVNIVTGAVHGRAGGLHDCGRDPDPLDAPLHIRQRPARRLRCRLGMPGRCPAGARCGERGRAVPSPRGWDCRLSGSSGSRGQCRRSVGAHGRRAALRSWIRTSSSHEGRPNLSLPQITGPRSGKRGAGISAGAGRRSVWQQLAV